MANRRFQQFYSTLHNKPVQLDCNFKVDATNSSGITGLKGPGIQSVYMHTSTTPAAGNPNPVAGYIYVQFQDNYNKYYFGGGQFMSPNTGSDVAIDASDALLSVGSVYVISVVGTSTAADWVAVGVPVGTTAAVGVSFVAIATGAGTGNGQVQLPATSGANVGLIDVIGLPNTSIASQRGTVAGQTSGSYMILRCLQPAFTAGAYTPAGTVAAPVFTGSAMGTHVHNFIVKGGQAAATTNVIADYAGPLLGKQAATDATYVGANSATNGGVVAVSAGTPAGTNSAPAFTGSAASLTGVMSWVKAAPAAGSIINLSFVFSNSGIIVQGE